MYEEEDELIDYGTLKAVPSNKCNDVIKDIRIRQLDYGYTIEVGCKKFAIQDRNQLLDLLESYIKNPAKIEKEYYENKETFFKNK